MNQDRIHIWFHRPASEVHQGEEHFRAFIIATLRRPPARIPEGLLVFGLARGGMAKTVERFKLQGLMGVAVNRSDIINGEYFQCMPADIRNPSGREESVPPTMKRG